MSSTGLYHGSDLTIETHHVDTGGVSDMSFALCHLLGFQLNVERIRANWNVILRQVTTIRSG